MTTLYRKSDSITTKISSDYVTVLTVGIRGNKLVTRDANGKLNKIAGPPITRATAKTVHVKNAGEMELLLRQVGVNSNQLLILGFVPGTEPGKSEGIGQPYEIVSKKIMAKALNVDPKTPEGLKAVLGWHEIKGEQCICRLKANMAPSSWCMLDIDAVRGMPPKLASMDRDDRLDALAEIIPGFATAGKVIVPSTTGRVLVDGKPMDATGEHFYIQLLDANDLERFGAVLLQRSLLKQFGFMRPHYSKKQPDKIVSRVPWGIVDPTTFSYERLVYDGCPEVHGEGLEVAEAVVGVFKGGRLDTSLLLDLTNEEATVYSEMTGQRVVKERRTETVIGTDGERIARQVYRYRTIDDRLLRMDTQVETNAGITTIEEYWKGDQGKLRCQTPFRESFSENGILNRHADGTPFVYDNGIRTRYVLSPDLIREHRAEVYLARMSQLTSDEIERVWTDGLRWMESHEHEKIRQRIHKITSLSLKELSAELKSAVNRWTKDKRKAATITLQDEIKDSGRTPILLNSTNIGDTVHQAEEVLFANRTDATVMSHGGRLVSVCMSKPTTVREVRKEREAKFENTPLTMMVDPYEFYGLTERLSQCIAFIKVSDGMWTEVSPPPAVVRAMLEQSYKNAPSLVGIIEHPVMGQNGELCR